MMTISDKILEAREQRYLLIQEKLRNHQTIVLVRVNFPGKNKNHYLANLIIHSLKIDDFAFSYTNKEFIHSEDGPYYLITSSEIADDLKMKLIYYEETYELGRFLDIDVYGQNGLISRKHKRKCYLCDELAHVCVREKKHSLNELVDFIAKQTMNYYINDLTSILNEAIEKELILDPKFGLVTIRTKGSHDDMDYQLMRKAKEAIIPYLLEIFKKSLLIKDLEQEISLFIKLGQEAEAAMFNATKGVNAYKGLIFHLSLLILTYGYYISRQTEDDFFALIKIVAKLVLSSNQKKYDTFGEIANEKYEIKGAKGEALSGYIHVQNVLRSFANMSLLEVLVKYIIDIEDTNLLKRAGEYGQYLEIKKLFKNLDLSNFDQVETLSNYCIENKWSFGGSADLLIVTIFVDHLIKKHEKIYLNQ
ncbi:hypothetical protein HF295_06640 [Hujiaoplasma nucleasis]|uniref:Citrate lyase holo-[acyl-carrier protein] synthase n=1 Tax=Hujiaoplasma nucleasis TaxID=2725268 RepID=A0A7L6N2Z8_9MOLU|nr:triphosphoribosyl-dephospho-CoA synthase [Hujiaoplasma nucleasis]QLY40543.1 hypothetical protein HF295_06640 [Hujiaoplasma nucleasis]